MIDFALFAAPVPIATLHCPKLRGGHCGAQAGGQDGRSPAGKMGNHTAGKMGKMRNI
jgi:hypothetical protein